MGTNEVVFNRGAVRPVQCLREGWQLIKEQYWLFLGITLVGVLVGGMAPFGILMGPAMCGIYLCFFRRANGQTVTFDMLFKGFNYFVPSLVATLLMVVPMMVIMMPATILYLVGIFSILPQPQQRGAPPDLSFLGPMFIMMGVFTLFMMAITIPLSALFMFSYPLIVDRELSGVDAVKLSFRSVWANIGGVLGLMVLNTLLSFIGAIFCIFPAYLLMPISFAAIAVAYQQVFPRDESPPMPDDAFAEGEPL